MDTGQKELVTVLQTSDRAAMVSAKLILDGAGIEYFVRNELLFGRSTTEPWLGGIELMVYRHDADSASGLLDGLIDEKSRY